MFKGKKILVTGGTGSLGQALTKKLLDEGVDTIRIYSRNENNQVKMKAKFQNDKLRFFLGDVRDLTRLKRALEDTDIVFHAAALKHVPLIEYNPFEAVKTNVLGTNNVIEASIDENVKTVIGVGTDKAVSPLNAYGATKLLMEKMIVTAGNFLSKERHHTKFVALRYGNVLGSNGSVLPVFINQIISDQKLTITDESMTRFNITMDEALKFILKVTKITKGSEVFLPKLDAYSLKDMKEVLFEIFGKKEESKISLRLGEKMHETLINKDEIKYGWESDSMYMIPNPSMNEDEIKGNYPDFAKINKMEEYSSEKVSRISRETLKDILMNHYLIKDALNKISHR